MDRQKTKNLIYGTLALTGIGFVVTGAFLAGKDFGWNEKKQLKH